MNPLIKLTLFIFIIFYLNGCESQDKSNHNKMIEILAEKSSVTNPETNIYENKKRLAWLQKQNFDNDIASKLQHQAVIANEMLNAGYPKQAIDQYCLEVKTKKFPLKEHSFQTQEVLNHASGY